MVFSDSCLRRSAPGKINRGIFHDVGRSLLSSLFLLLKANLDRQQFLGGKPALLYCRHTLKLFLLQLDNLDNEYLPVCIS